MNKRKRGTKRENGKRRTKTMKNVDEKNKTTEIMVDEHDKKEMG